MKKYLLTLILGALAIGTALTCKQTADEAALSILGTNGGYTYFKGTVNTDVTPSCGSASAVSTSTGTGTGSGSGTGTGSTSQNIESYLAFKVFGYSSDAYIFTRYTHTNGKTTFTLTPSTTTVATCNTLDGITCTTTGGSTRTCETADSIKCGGTKTFIFSQASTSTFFQAKSGTIDWSDGFALDATQAYVLTSNLSFDLVDASGNFLKGSLTCTSK